MKTTTTEPTTTQASFPTIPPPATPSDDWRNIKLYGPSSEITAGSKFDDALQKIRERQAVHLLMLDWLDKHKRTLAGLSWDIAYLKPEVEIRCYLGEARARHEHQRTPEEIASRWPDAEWKRELPRYTEDQKRDWVAMVDGVSIRIESAEVYKPVHIPGAGTRIHLPRRRGHDSQP